MDPLGRDGMCCVESLQDTYTRVARPAGKSFQTSKPLMKAKRLLLSIPVVRSWMAASTAEVEYRQLQRDAGGRITSPARPSGRFVAILRNTRAGVPDASWSV